MDPIQLDTDTHINKITDTTPEQARANTRFAQQSEVDQRNASKVLEYEEQWKKYVASRDARPDATNLIVPVPARAEAVFADERGWPYIDMSDKPVVAPHTYVPAVKTPGASIFGAASVFGSTDSLLFNAQLYKPFTFGVMTFQRIA